MGLETSIVVRRITIAAGLALLIAAAATAQANQESLTVNVVLLGGVPSEQVHITYYRYGPFGAYGGVSTPKPHSLSYQIPTHVDGKAAGQIKGFIWASGCRMSMFDAPLLDRSDVQEYFSCDPLGTVTLYGRIRVNDLPRKKPMEVRFDYIASWACHFFGLADCMVPQIELGTVKPDVDGAFGIELPDFSADPISSDSEGGAEFQLVLREVMAWNLAALLEPEMETLRTPGNALKIVPSYPHNLFFSARKIH